MLLFAGMMLVIVIYASPTELESMPFDLKLLYQTTTETQSPLQDEVDSTVAGQFFEN